MPTPTDSPERPDQPNPTDEPAANQNEPAQTEPVQNEPAQEGTDEEPSAATGPDPDTPDEAGSQHSPEPAAATGPEFPYADEYLAAYSTDGSRQRTRPPVYEHLAFDDGPQDPPTPPRPDNGIATDWVRPTRRRLVAGAAVGIAAKAGIPTWLVRAAFVVLTITSGVGLAIYLAAWALMPAEGAPESAADRVRREFDQVETANGKFGIAAVALAIGFLLATSGHFLGMGVIAILIVIGVTVARSSTA